MRVTISQPSLGTFLASEFSASIFGYQVPGAHTATSNFLVTNQHPFIDVPMPVSRGFMRTGDAFIQGPVVPPGITKNGMQVIPLFSERMEPFRVQASGNAEKNAEFYGISRGHGIDYDRLPSLLKDVFRFSDKKLEEVLILLQKHAHLSDNFALEVAEAIQRYVDGAKPRADRNADVILRFAEFERQGARRETLESMHARLARSESEIGRIQSYAVEGKLTVRQAMLRKLSKASVKKLNNHKLRAAMEEFLEVSEINIGGLFMDFVEDESIPHKLRKQVLQKLKLSYDPDIAEVTKDSNPSFDLDDPQYLKNILAAMLGELTDPVLAQTSARSAYGEHVIGFLIHYMKQYPHFQEHLSSIEDCLGKEWSKANDIKPFYEHVRELVVNGIPDYAFADLFPTVRKHMMAQFPNEREVTEKLQEWGVEIPEAGLTDEWLMARADEYLAESKLMRNRGKRKVANNLGAKYKYLIGLNLTTASKIGELSSWRDFIKEVPVLLSKTSPRKAQINAKLIFRYFINQYHKRASALNSFGQYFEEIVSDAEPLEIWMVPVKGISAGVAIDSGSDCGKGQAFNRTAMDEYTTFLLTNEQRTALWGYVGMYEVDGDGKLVLQSDVMNPSTQLDLSGSSFLGQVRDHYARMANGAQETGNPIAAFLASKDPELVSNITSIQQSAPGYLGDDAAKVFTELRPRMPSEVEFESSFDVLRKRLDELLMQLREAYNIRLDRMNVCLTKLKGAGKMVSTSIKGGAFVKKYDEYYEYRPFWDILSGQCDHTDIGSSYYFQIDAKFPASWLGLDENYEVELKKSLSFDRMIKRLQRGMRSDFKQGYLRLGSDEEKQVRDLIDLLRKTPDNERELEEAIISVWEKMCVVAEESDFSTEPMTEQNYQSDPSYSAIFYQP